MTSKDLPCRRCGAKPGSSCVTVRSKPLGRLVNPHLHRLTDRKIKMIEQKVFAAQPEEEP